MGIGHWALGIGHWALGIGHWLFSSASPAFPTPYSPLPTPHTPHLKKRSARKEIRLQSTQRLRRRYLQCVRLICG